MQTIEISIPTPCHENWNSMTPTEQGRFCNACAKQVVDFSAMSDAQVLNYFSNLKEEKLCGRVYPDQLNRTISMPKEIKRSKFWYWNYITMLFLLFTKSGNSKAQVVKELITTSPAKQNKEKEETFLVGKVSSKQIKESRIILGKVIDKKGNPIIGASVVIKGTTLGTSTDKNGMYKIDVKIKNEIIVISAVGFTSKEVNISGLQDQDDIFTILDMQMMGEVVVVGMVVSNEGEYYQIPSNPNHVALFQIKDNATLRPVNKATITITNSGNNKTGTFFSDEKGLYKLKNIKEDDSFYVKISAPGFKETVIEIKGSDFNKRKDIKQIFLERIPVETDYKKLDSVVINSYPHSLKGKMVICSRDGQDSKTGGIYIKKMVVRSISDSLKIISTKLNNSLKIFPNPVSKGNFINLELKFQELGNFGLEIIDVAGKVVLQKALNAPALIFSEQIATDLNWSSGIYFIRVVKGNKLVSTAKFLIK